MISYYYVEDTNCRIFLLLTQYLYTKYFFQINTCVVSFRGCRMFVNGPSLNPEPSLSVYTDSSTYTFTVYLCTSDT